MKGPRLALAALCALVLCAGLVLGSRLPYVAEPGDGALVRLSWRSAGERIEACREPSEAERAGVPAHMRLPQICQGRLAPFELVVSIDGTLRFDGEIRAAGAREDRPIYVFQELPVAPGEHRIEVRFEVRRPEGAPASQRPPLFLDETATLGPREILLVTHDPDTDRLVVRTAPGRSQED